ncbi:hypothetical protein ABC195_16015 [Microbacterium sp. 2P01SA-2]|uniref:hypothetical protein n=1 Tax=unclassified Microbacterium TaxID=2609290 RepID=UPI0039A2CF72
MSNVSFNFDENAFKRIAEDAVRDLAAKQTRELEQIRQRYTGHPIAEIKPALQRLFAEDGGSITEPELTEWAQLISDGSRIEFKPEKIRW